MRLNGLVTGDPWQVDPGPRRLPGAGRLRPRDRRAVRRSTSCTRRTCAPSPSTTSTCCSASTRVSPGGRAGEVRRPRPRRLLLRAQHVLRRGAATARLRRTPPPRARRRPGGRHPAGAHPHDISVVVDGHRLLCDPGFGMSLLRPVPLADGGEDDYLPGWRYRVRRTPTGAGRSTGSASAGWEVAHTTDELEVLPVDVAMGHHFTSTFPSSHFTSGLMRHPAPARPPRDGDPRDADGPLAGGPTEHRPLRDGELGEWLDTLEVRPVGGGARAAPRLGRTAPRRWLGSSRVQRLREVRGLRFRGPAAAQPRGVG